MLTIRYAAGSHTVTLNGVSYDMNRPSSDDIPLRLHRKVIREAVLKAFNRRNSKRTK
jgi:hypothetical protein